MKTYILIVLVVVMVSATDMWEDTGKLKFDTDPFPESPISVMMKGTVNPRDESENHVQSFFRLAEQLIPIAEASYNDKKTDNVQWTGQWCFGGIGPFSSLCFYFTAEMWIGWHSEHEGTTGFYNLTYTPYNFFRVGGNVSVSSDPADVSYGAYFNVLDMEVPVNLLLARDRICYSGKVDLGPVGVIGSIKLNLLQCLRSVPDKTQWECDKVKGAEFRHIILPVLPSAHHEILPYDCIEF